MTTSIQEMQWVLRAQCRDRDALEALLRSVQPSMRRYLSGVAGATDADDLLQNVLVIIARRIGSLDEPKLFRPCGEITSGSGWGWWLRSQPLGTVKSRLAYGLNALREQFKTPGGSHD